MGDTLTKEQRSFTMSKIRSKWTAPETKVHNYLKAYKIRHKMHPKLKGSPDILIGGKIAILLNGCFWHKCPKCYKRPKTNKEYWIQKIRNNVKRDKKNNKILKTQGFKVINIWEHQSKNDFNKVLGGLLKWEKK